MSQAASTERSCQKKRRVEQKPAKFLAVYSPTGFEKFFDEAVDLDVTDTETYVAKAEALTKKYNMQVVGPPLEG